MVKFAAGKFHVSRRKFCSISVIGRRIKTLADIQYLSHATRSFHCRSFYASSSQVCFQFESFEIVIISFGDILSMEGGFDVYNIETAMPKIDLDAIESHLRAAREEERRVSKYSFARYIFKIIERRTNEQR